MAVIAQLIKILPLILLMILDPLINLSSYIQVDNASDIFYALGLVMAFGVSVILAFLMNTYRGKTYLERLLFLRECLIALIIGRILITIVFGLTNAYFIITSWYLFCIVCGLIVITIVKEHLTYKDSEIGEEEEENPYHKG